MKQRLTVSLVVLLASVSAAVVGWDGQSRPLAEAAASVQIAAVAPWN
jgi:hypothetical protein